MDINHELPCHLCGGFQPILLGQLGNRTHLRCRDCGYDYSYSTSQTAAKAKAFQASSSDGSTITRDTPKAAAEAFFAKYPRKRKCNVREGLDAGAFFIVVASKGNRWTGVTPKTASTLEEDV